jgi:hypothetical protein
MELVVLPLFFIYSSLPRRRIPENLLFEGTKNGDLEKATESY